jgi:hypothetical protein
MKNESCIKMSQRIPYPCQRGAIEMKSDENIEKYLQRHNLVELVKTIKAHRDF